MLKNFSLFEIIITANLLLLNCIILIHFYLLHLQEKTKKLTKTIGNAIIRNKGEVIVRTPAEELLHDEDYLWEMREKFHDN